MQLIQQFGCPLINFRMKTFLIPALIIFWFTKLPAQQDSSCRCTSVLSEIVHDIETSYPGFPSKTSSNPKAYLIHKQLLVSKAANISDRENCFYLLEKYLSYFGDNHLLLSDRTTKPKPHLMNGETAHKASNGQSGIEGTWRRDSDGFSVAIRRIQKNTYRAFVMHSANEQTRISSSYFDLLGDRDQFRIRRYDSFLTTDLMRGRVMGNTLIEPGCTWTRKVKGKPFQRPANYTDAWNKNFSHHKLGPGTYYLGIPEFSMDPFKFNSIVVNDIIPAISAGRTRHLILDLRNNFGGNSSFLSLIRLVYQKPIALAGDYVYSTPKMIARYTRSKNPLHQKMLPQLVAGPGKFVQRDSTRYFLKESLTYPQQVSIIVNDNCASSTEYLLVIARLSSKVKIYGRPTAGTLDYSELLGPEPLSCKGYSFMVPTTKSFWTDHRPIDKTGIIPDVDLSQYPENQWVQIVKAQKL